MKLYFKIKEIILKREIISLLAQEQCGGGWKERKPHTNLEELKWLAVDSCENIDGYTLVQ